MTIRNQISKKLVSILMSGWSEGTIEAQRVRQDNVIRFARLPAGIHCQPVSVGGVPAEWIEPAGAGQGVILYLHGGCFALGSVKGHREFISRLAYAAQHRVLGINYRLAPEHPFPAAMEDIATAYHWLQAAGVDPSQIILAGDSAGGGLALSTMLSLRDGAEPLPAGAVCISPWTDLALTGKSMQSKAKVDPIMSPGVLQKYARSYAGDHELSSPLISPHYANLQGLPPLLIQVGTDEILLEDATRLAEKARATGVDVILQIWDEMFHVFPIVSFLPETKKAVRQMAEFIARQLEPHSEKMA